MLPFCCYPFASRRKVRERRKLAPDGYGLAQKRGEGDASRVRKKRSKREMRVCVRQAEKIFIARSAASQARLKK